MVDNSKVFEGKKYMWDGEEYSDEGAAKAKAEEYAKDDFETKVVEDEGNYYVYSRRVVTEIEVEGQPPM